MEKIIEGIVLRSIEFKDNDKIVTLLTKEEGKFTLKMRGVKNPKSKLRYASIPFFYGRYILTGTKTGFVVTGVDSIRHYDYSTMNLTYYYLATLVIEIAEKLSIDGFEDRELFDYTIKALSEINSTINPLQQALEILRDYLVISGHGLNTDYGENVNGFSYDEGGLCDLSKSAGLKLTQSSVDALKALLNNKQIPEGFLANTLTLIASYFTAKTTKKLNTVEQIIKMYEILV